MGRLYWEALGAPCQMPVGPSYNGAAVDGSSRYGAVKCSTMCAATCVTEVAAERWRVFGQLRQGP
eukprot:2319763-Pyramimonas_sp.AAC.1